MGRRIVFATRVHTLQAAARSPQMIEAFILLLAVLAD
jgi:hypothetical protein